MTTYVRKLKSWTVFFLAIAVLELAAQNPDPANRADKDSMPEGPFRFEPGEIHPTYMDAFHARPVVKSPDGKLGVTVTGPIKSWGAWVTISPSSFPGGAVHIWPIQSNVSVLWRPDSRGFALTDNRYANLSYVLVCGTEFRLGEDESGLGVPITDLTPIVREAFEDRTTKYYKTDEFETLLFYAQALRWTGNGELLIGISARTLGPLTFPNKGQMEWDVAYLVNVPSTKVMYEVGKEQLLSEYKIKVHMD
jgi:hypothetical protein